MRIAEGSLFGPVLLAIFSVMLALWYLVRLPCDLSLAGLVVLGYMVGNRGFAQVSYPGLPLFPAEALWLLAAFMIVIRNMQGSVGGLFSGALARCLLFWIA